jgi:hypothetical protein
VDTGAALTGRLERKSEARIVVAMIPDDEQFRRAEPIIGERKARQLWIAARTDPELARDIEAYLAVLISDRLGANYKQPEPLLPPPPAELAAGDYVLGNVVYGGREAYPFGLREQEWLSHGIVCGIPGSGKSNILALIARELSRHGKPWLMFDWKKSMRAIKATDWGRDVTVFSIGRSRFHFNPLIPPPGTMPEVWLQMLLQTIETSFYCGFGVSHLIRKALHFTYTEYDVYNAYREKRPVSEWPIPLDLLEYIEAYPARGRMAGWRDSAERALDVLCFPQLRDCMNVRTQLPFEKILERPVILELDLLSDHEKVFAVDSMMLWIYYYALQNSGPRERLRSVIIVDEAHFIVSKRQQDLTGTESVVEKDIRMLRELGIRCLLASQSPSALSPIVLGNTYLTISLNLKHEADVAAAAHTMLLSAEERKYLGQLPVGEAIVKLQGRYPKPFLVRFPDAGIVKGAVTDEDILQVPETFAPKVEIIRSPGEPGAVPKAEQGDKNKEKLKQRNIRTERKRLISVVRVLNDVVQHQESAYRDRLKRLTVGSYTGDQARAIMKEKELATEHEVYGPTGRLERLEIGVTEAGRRLLEEHRQLLESDHVTKRHGGQVHQAVLAKLADRLRAEGWQVQVEVPIGAGRQADLVAEKPDAGRRVAVEFETGSAREGMITNITKALDAGFQEVWSVGVDEQVTSRIQRDLALSGLDRDQRVKVSSVTDLSW